MNTITVMLVQDQAGNIDEQASQLAFNQALSTMLTERTIERSHIADAVRDLFDAAKGNSIALSTLGAMAATRMGAQPENHQVLSKRVVEFVRENATGDAPLFEIRKGSGVRRLSDKVVS